MSREIEGKATRLSTLEDSLDYGCQNWTLVINCEVVVLSFAEVTKAANLEKWSILRGKIGLVIKIGQLVNITDGISSEE